MSKVRTKPEVLECHPKCYRHFVEPVESPTKGLLLPNYLENPNNFKFRSYLGS